MIASRGVSGAPGEDGTFVNKANQALAAGAAALIISNNAAGDFTTAALALPSFTVSQANGLAIRKRVTLLLPQLTSRGPGANVRMVPSGVEKSRMSYPWAAGRRCVALGLVALLPVGLAPAHASRAAAAPRPSSSAAVERPAPLTLVHDGHGLVTVVGEQASVRELLRVLSKWFELPAIDLQAIPDVRRAVRFEQVPVAQVVKQVLASVGWPGVQVPARPRRLPPARPSSTLMMVHDGRGAVTVSGEQASIREVLALLSRWFDFPIVNPDTIPDARRSMRFDRVPVTQLVDGLLRNVSVNYVMLADPQTLVPSKVLAAPLSAATGPRTAAPGRAGSPSPAAVVPFPAMPVSPEDPGPAMPGDPMRSMPPPEGPVHGAMPSMPPMPSNPQPNYPLLPADPLSPSEPSQAPGASRPGVVVPVPPRTGQAGVKPPGAP